MSEYVDSFTELVEQLSAYTTSRDHLYYATRFIDGLRDDIRPTVLVARPQDLDTAATLALLQEEALDQGRRREFKKPDGSVFSRSATIKGALPLPSPPPRPTPPGAVPDDRRPGHKTRAVDDKFSNLCSSRKAHGLCVRCADISGWPGCGLLTDSHARPLSVLSTVTPSGTTNLLGSVVLVFSNPTTLG